MAEFKKVEPVKILMGRLRHGGDLLEELTELCQKQNVQLGRVEALGAVKKARICFYEQKAREYRFTTLNHPLEITSLVGNVSLKDGEPVIHTHVTLADESGNCYGGHLAPGTIVFACEFTLEVFAGPALVRDFDKATGLPLWRMSN